jgi:hypothetical protein
MKKASSIDLVRLTLKNGKILVFARENIGSVAISSPIKKIEMLRVVPSPNQ